MAVILSRKAGSSSSGGGAPSGPAGGSLAGTYPNPTIGANAVGTTQITDGTVTAAKLATGVGGQSIAYESRSSNTILAAGDKGKTIEYTASFTQTLTAAATLASGWWCVLKSVSTSAGAYVTVTVDPNASELINGLPTLKIATGTMVLLTCDGSAFKAQALEGAVSPADVAQTNAWYDAADSGTITQSGGAVSAWTDKSGSGNDLAEATNKPTTGTRTINSLNTLDFDGTNDQLRKTSGIDLIASALYAVVEPDSVTGVHVIARGQANTQSLYGSGADLIGEQEGTTASKTSALAIGTPVLLVARGRLGSFVARAGGAYGTATNCAYPIHINTEINIGVNTGGGSFFDGKIAEVVFCTGVMGPLDDLWMRTYLANKWGVTA